MEPGQSFWRSKQWPDDARLATIVIPTYARMVCAAPTFVVSRWLYLAHESEKLVGMGEAHSSPHTDVLTMLAGIEDEWLVTP